MDLEKFREKTNDHCELTAACEKLWNDYVRTELIYGKGLLLCTSCISLFYAKTADSDHPKHHIIRVHEFCLDHHITSLSKTVDMFRQLTQTTEKSSTTTKILPVYSAKHRVVTIAQSAITGLLPIERLNRVQETLVEIEYLKKTVSDLKSEVHSLRAENEELLVEIVRLKSNFAYDKKALHRLATDMLVHCEDHCKCLDSIHCPETCVSSKASGEDLKTK
jgi:hypothetical protein